MSRVTVLHVITRLAGGGAAENTTASIATLGRAGYACRLAVGLGASEPDAVASARRRDVDIVDVPGLGREADPVRDLVALWRLVALVRAQRPAIVHTHTSKAGFIGRLAARLARVPAVIHQPHGHVFYGYWGPRRTAAYLRLERLAARWADRIVTLTDRGTEEHLRWGIGRRAQFVTVPSGVPTAELRASAPTRQAARARLGVAGDAWLVVALGRLVPVKGFDLLVEALPVLVRGAGDVRLMLVGDGPERAALASQAALRGVADRVHLTGAVRDVTPFLAAADVVAAPSRNEGMGRAIVEALALGVPVVGTDVGGIPDVIGDDECGRLVPPDDVPALVSALLDLAHDPMLRAKLGDAGRRRAERFSTAHAEARLLALYADLAREKGLVP